MPAPLLSDSAFVNLKHKSPVFRWQSMMYVYPFDLPYSVFLSSSVRTLPVYFPSDFYTFDESFHLKCPSASAQEIFVYFYNCYLYCSNAIIVYSLSIGVITL